MDDGIYRLPVGWTPADMSGPVRQHLLTGDCKHHYVLPNGRPVCQDKPLEKSSEARRLSYQLVVNADGSTVFLNLLIKTVGNYGLQLAPPLLTLAWLAPDYRRPGAPPIGMPDELIVPKSVLRDEPVPRLQLFAKLMDVKVTNPVNAAAAGVHLVREMKRRLTAIMNQPHADSMNWGSPLVLGVVAGAIAKAMATRVRFVPPNNRHGRPISDEQLERIASICRCPTQQFHDTVKFFSSVYWEEEARLHTH